MQNCRIACMVDVRKIFDSVSEIWIITDVEGTVLLTSKQLEKFKYIIQTTPVEGSSIFDSIPESWKDLAKNVLDTLLNSRSPSILEASYTTEEAKEIHFEIKCTGIRDENDHVSQIFIE